MIKTILFATDASGASERALVYVEHLARLEQARVHVFHAYEPPQRYSGIDGFEELREQFRRVAQAAVDDSTEFLREAGVEAEGEVVEGAAAPAILEAARRHDVDLIVIGTRGPSSVAEMLLGSVSTQVLRYAPCPVLVVP
ncbi:MAG TPA: universal stress protein [Caldilineae bacterium]|nr:universal stress protein [Caldilineae bacterium]